MNEVCLGSEEFTICDCDGLYLVTEWIADNVDILECGRVRITITHIIEDEEVAPTEP